MKAKGERQVKNDLFFGRERGGGNNRREYMMENCLGKAGMCC